MTWGHAWCKGVSIAVSYFSDEPICKMGLWCSLCDSPGMLVAGVSVHTCEIYALGALTSTCSLHLHKPPEEGAVLTLLLQLRKLRLREVTQVEGRQMGL